MFFQKVFLYSWKRAGRSQCWVSFLPSQLFLIISVYLDEEPAAPSIYCFGHTIKTVLMICQPICSTHYAWYAVMICSCQRGKYTFPSSSNILQISFLLLALAVISFTWMLWDSIWSIKSAKIFNIEFSRNI